MLLCFSAPHGSAPSEGCCVRRLPCNVGVSSMVLLELLAALPPPRPEELYACCCEPSTETLLSCCHLVAADLEAGVRLTKTCVSLCCSCTERPLSLRPSATKRSTAPTTSSPSSTCKPPATRRSSGSWSASVGPPGPHNFLVTDKDAPHDL